MKTMIVDFYKKHLPDGVTKDAVLTAICPFCANQEDGKKGKLVVFLNPTSFFYGYFRCLSNCMERGFAHWFAHLKGCETDGLPLLEDEDPAWQNISFPNQNINVEIDGFHTKLTDDELTFFSEASIGNQTLRQLKAGYNGRYLVYPYGQIDGNVYSARCVHPEKENDYFWYGDSDFKDGPHRLFNIEELQRCAGGALFLCEGEENLLAIKQLGFPGVAYWDKRILENLDSALFSQVKTVFIITRNNFDSLSAARTAATSIGFKVRILKWKADTPQDYSVRQFAAESGSRFAKLFGSMIVASRPFSPFATPEKEHLSFFSSIRDMGGEEYGRLQSGFPLLDTRLGGIHGINVLGGGPKVGKSCFMIQIATMMAGNKVPILYYDFENGRQRIYQRTFTRLSRIDQERIILGDINEKEQLLYNKTRDEFRDILRYFRVINDRKITPEVMRRHIDFLRHETQSDYTVVVIDSLHKLPFKDLSERRSGIDAWLRQMETIRDELRVSFLVVSELSRGEGGSYDDEPHMGVFKGSGDIEYSADNAMVLLADWDHMQSDMAERTNKLWLVASREHTPGLVGNYILEYPLWSFREEAAS